MSESTNIATLKAGTKVALRDMKPKDQVKHLLEQNKAVIQQALPRHMNPERLMRVAITSVTSNPALLECYVPTLIGGIVQCSQMGLEPNTVLGHAYLVPFWNSQKNRKDAQVVIGYKGLIDLARRSGQIVSLAAHAVYEADVFEFEYGLEERLRHIPADTEDRGLITHFYAVAHMKGGGHAYEVMTAREVMRIRDQAAIKNRAKRDSDGNLIIKGPWSEHFEEMGRKTAIRRLAKYLPLSVEMATAIALDERHAAAGAQNLDGVLDGEYTPEFDDGDGGGGQDAGGDADPRRGSDERTPAATVERERTGAPPADDGPSFADAVRMIKAGNYDEARDVTKGEPFTDQQRASIADMIRNHQGGETPAQQRARRAPARGVSAPE